MLKAQRSGLTHTLCLGGEGIWEQGKPSLIQNVIYLHCIPNSAQPAGGLPDTLISITTKGKRKRQDWGMWRVSKQG